MSDAQQTPPAWETLSSEEQASALFANLVMQQTNAALLMLGQMAHPETGKPEVDLDGASLFIDTLEMLQAKTRGNLGKQEEAMLKQSLSMLRMAYVEKINSVATAANAPAKEAATEMPATLPPASTQPAASAADPNEESKKKFSKKY